MYMYMCAHKLHVHIYTNVHMYMRLQRAFELCCLTLMIPGRSTSTILFNWGPRTVMEMGCTRTEHKDSHHATNRSKECLSAGTGVRPEPIIPKILPNTPAHKLLESYLFAIRCESVKSLPAVEDDTQKMTPAQQ